MRRKGMALSLTAISAGALTGYERVGLELPCVLEKGARRQQLPGFFGIAGFDQRFRFLQVRLSLCLGKPDRHQHGQDKEAKKYKNSHDGLCKIPNYDCNAILGQYYDLSISYVVFMRYNINLCGW